MSDTFNDPLEQRIKERIRTIRGWPAPHVNFRDVTTLFEVGLAFNRELVYRSITPTYDPNTTVFVRAALFF